MVINLKTRKSQVDTKSNIKYNPEIPQPCKFSSQVKNVSVKYFESEAIKRF